MNSRLKTAGVIVGGAVLGYIVAMPIAWGLSNNGKSTVLLAGMIVGATVAVWRKRRRERKDRVTIEDAPQAGS